MSKKAETPDMRVANHPVLGPASKGKQVTFTWNNKTVYGYEDEPIAAALLAINVRILRYSDRQNLPRGIYCNIGHCYECRVVVDGKRDVRACLTPVRERIVVERQQGLHSPGGEETLVNS